MIADYRDKYLLDLKYRVADEKRGYSADQVKTMTEEATLLRGQAEKQGIGPTARSQKLTRAATIDRSIAQVSARAEYGQSVEALEKMQRDQPDVMTADRLKVRVAELDKVLATKLKQADDRFAQATAGLQQELTDQSIEQAAQALRRTVETLNLKAQELEARAKVIRDPVAAIDLRMEAAQTRFQADSASRDLSLSQAIEEQEKLVRANRTSRETADEVIASLREQNSVSMNELQTNLEAVTRELTEQKELVDAQQRARLTEVQFQGQELRVKKMMRSGQGLEALQAQKAMDLGRFDFDLQAKLRDLKFDKSISEDIKAQIRTEMEQNAGLQREEIEFNAKLALEDNQARRRSMGANSEVALLNARSALAKSYGGDSSDFDRQAAVITENERFAESLRSIDEQARQLGLSAGEIARFKESATELNNLNLKNIEAQFSPFTEALRGAAGAFQTFLGDIISGNESIGDAFQKMVANVGNMLAQMAARLITQQLFSGLFGGLFGGGGGGLFGGGGGLFGGLFGKADGGDIEPVDHSALRRRPDQIGAALRKEGPNSVLIAATPGEMVLTRAQRDDYLRYRSRRGLIEEVSRSSFGNPQQADLIRGYKAGGIVAASPMATSSVSSAPVNSSSSITIPITINQDGGADRDGGMNPEMEARLLREQILAVVVAHDRKTRRPRAIV
jgi:hypothetical protein